VLDRHVLTGALFLCCGKNYPTHFESCIHPLLGLALLDPHTFDGAHVVDEVIMAEKRGRPLLDGTSPWRVLGGISPLIKPPVECGFPSFSRTEI
jgi:hypothetical protein